MAGEIDKEMLFRGTQSVRLRFSSQGVEVFQRRVFDEIEEKGLETRTGNWSFYDRSSPLPRSPSRNASASVADFVEVFC